MTFSRLTSTPLPLTAYVVNATPEEPSALRISLAAPYADLPKHDALDLANYIYEKFGDQPPQPEETSD